MGLKQSKVQVQEAFGGLEALGRAGAGTEMLEVFELSCLGDFWSS